MRTNDMLLGGMTLILMGTVGSTAYYGFQHAQSSKATTAAEENLGEVTKRLESKESSYAKISDTNSRLVADLRETKNQLDETSLSLQKREEMIANGGGAIQIDGQPNEGEAVALKIAQRDIADLQRRIAKLQSFSDEVTNELDVNSLDEALVVFRKRVATERVAANADLQQPEKEDEVKRAKEDQITDTDPKKSVAKETEPKTTTEPRVRVRNPQQDPKNSDSIADNGPALTSPDNTEQPNGKAETSSRESNDDEPSVATAEEGYDPAADPGLVAVTPRARTRVERPSLSNDANQGKIADAIMLREIQELKEQLSRRDRILQEQAELIERIKPTKTGTRSNSASDDDSVVRMTPRETGMRVIRESSVNDGFSSRREYTYEEAQDGTVIETRILP